MLARILTHNDKFTIFLIIIKRQKLEFANDQKVEENKPPLTFQNTYLKVCLNMFGTIFFGSRQRPLIG